VISTCTVKSVSKKECVLIFWISALGVRHRRGDKLFRVKTGGFAAAGRDWTSELSGRCNKMLLRPRTDLGLLFFEGERETGCRDGSSKGPWSMLGIQRVVSIGPFYQDGGPKEREEYR
jgi:hypothetical protein